MERRKRAAYFLFPPRVTTIEMMRMKHAFNPIVATIALALSFAAPVAADPFEDEATASGKGDYVTALRLLRPLADQGDAWAQASPVLYSKLTKLSC